MESGSRNSGEFEEPRTETIATLSRKQSIARKKSCMENAAAQESLSYIRRTRRSERQRRIRKRRSNNNEKKMMIKESTPSVCNNVSKSHETEEKAEIEKRIVALQRIVPGGESLGVDKLFEETAGYILALQFQVKALKFLADFVEGSEKERRKLGG